MGIPDHLTCLLINLYVGQEATVRTLYGTTDYFNIKKGVQQGSLLSPCLFNLYSDHIMRNTGLGELQAGIKIGGRNINNFRYVDGTTLMAESEEDPHARILEWVAFPFSRESSQPRDPTQVKFSAMKTGKYICIYITF